MRNQISKEEKQIRPTSDLGHPTSDHRGITLIALIITIIVILILLSVIIGIAVNSGLFGHAGDASRKWGDAQKTEDKLGNGEVKFTVGDKTYNSIDEYLAENLSGGNTMPAIPEGFTVSGIPEEKTVDGGLVIYEIPAGTDTSAPNFWTETVTVGDQTYPKVQTEYNQFVWVPVETPYVTKAELTKIITESAGTITTETQALQSLANSGIYPMAVKVDDTNYRGVLYYFSAGASGVKMRMQEFSSFANYNDGSATYNRDPAKLSSTDSHYVNQEKEPLLRMQKEYNNIVKSIASQKGFWVARYELSYNSTAAKGESKRGKTVASAADTATSSWYGLYEASKTVVNSESTKSAMISGSQWDQIMIWMKEVKNTSDNTKYYILNSSNMGNYSTESPQVSGYKNEYAVKQVYDLGGNLVDWTSEASQVDVRIVRGGDYYCNGSNFPACVRYNFIPDSTDTCVSTRSALYIESTEGGNTTGGEYFTYDFDTATKTATITGIREGYRRVSYYGYLEDEAVYVSGLVVDGEDITELIIPETVQYEGETYTITSIGPYAFGNDNAFLYGMKFTTLVIPDTVKSIQAYAFNCSSLQSVTIPNSVISIGKGAFCNLTLNTKIDCEFASKPSGWDDGWTDCQNVKWLGGNAPSDSPDVVIPENLPIASPYTFPALSTDVSTDVSEEDRNIFNKAVEMGLVKTYTGYSSIIELHRESLVFYCFKCLNKDQRPGGVIPMPFSLDYEVQCNSSEWYSSCTPNYEKGENDGDIECYWLWYLPKSDSLLGYTNFRVRAIQYPQVPLQQLGQEFTCYVQVLERPDYLKAAQALNEGV